MEDQIKTEPGEITQIQADINQIIRVTTVIQKRRAAESSKIKHGCKALRKYDQLLSGSLHDAIGGKKMTGSHDDGKVGESIPIKSPLYAEFGTDVLIKEEHDICESDDSNLSMESGTPDAINQGLDNNSKHGAKRKSDPAAEKTADMLEKMTERLEVVYEKAKNDSEGAEHRERLALMEEKLRKQESEAMVMDLKRQQKVLEHKWKMEELRMRMDENKMRIEEHKLRRELLAAELQEQVNNC